MRRKKFKFGAVYHEAHLKARCYMPWIQFRELREAELECIDKKRPVTWLF